MDCTREKQCYHFHVTEEEVDGKMKEVMSCKVECHHDLAALCQKAEHEDGLTPEHACQMVLGLRLLHHALKKNADKPGFETFLAQLDDFKHKLKAAADCGCHTEHPDKEHCGAEHCDKEHPDKEHCNTEHRENAPLH